MKNLIIGLTTSAGIFTTNPTQAQELTDPAIIARSQVSPGDTARLGRVLAKARQGDDDDFEGLFAGLLDPIAQERNIGTRVIEQFGYDDRNKRLFVLQVRHAYRHGEMLIIGPFTS